MSKGRPTQYRGIRMRSRLEADYAAFLDRKEDITWRYEAECYAGPDGQWLPDFSLTNKSDKSRALVELKPHNFNPAEILPLALRMRCALDAESRLPDWNRDRIPHTHLWIVGWHWGHGWHWMVQGCPLEGWSIKGGEEELGVERGGFLGPWPLDRGPLFHVSSAHEIKGDGNAHDV